ncbi:MAG TPA: hypothetical protein VLM37_08315, partial [Fibrobacteraceae bacterium]|nr:hypothetical protein [Fibrobacteraceae bacterium]
MFSVIGAAALVICPWLTEIFANPVTMSDQLGEFVEVLVPEGVPEDSLFLWLDDERVSIVSVPSSGRLVFCHGDSLWLWSDFPVPCENLDATLANSKSLQLSLSFGDCRDTAWLEPAVEGMSWQRASVPPDSAVWVT